jgi:hypothetical protein
MSKIGVVIARYNENIDWVQSIKHKICIYNKGTDNVTLKYFPLQNVGREAHTYLHHIVTNYDHLDDHTVFLQGNPTDHGFFDTFGTIENFNHFNFNLGFHPFLRHLENHQYFKCDKDDCNLFHLAAYHNIHLPQQNSYEFVQGAQFAVKKDNILSRPKKVYEHLLNTSSNNDNMFAHTMKKIWKYLFNR